MNTHTLWFCEEIPSPGTLVIYLPHVMGIMEMLKRKYTPRVGVVGDEPVMHGNGMVPVRFTDIMCSQWIHMGNLMRWES